VGLSAKATGFYQAVEEQTKQVTISKAEQKAPTIDSTTATADSITVTASGSEQGVYEYAIVKGANGTAPADAGEWENNGTFTGLDEASAYTVFVRYASDKNHSPSPSVKETVYTAYATPTGDNGYTIDYAAETVKAKVGYKLSVDNGKTWKTEAIKIEPGATFQVRQAANGDIPASAAQTVMLDGRGGAPDVTADGNSETINTTEQMQWRVGDTGKWTDCTADMSFLDFGWDGTKAVTVQIRTAATDKTFASEAKEVTTPARQNTPSVTIDYSKETVRTTAQMQWRTGDDGTWQNCEDNMSLAAIGWKSAEINVQFRTKASGDVAASEAVKFTIPARPDAPDVTINGDAETLTVPAGSEYKVANGDWTACDDTTLALSTFSWNGETAVAVQIRTKAVENTSFASEAKELTIPARQSAPNVTIDYSNETVNMTDKMEWSKDGQAWTDCTKDMALSVFGWDGKRAVTVQIRTKADGTTVASQIQTLTIPTRVAVPDITINGAAETLTVPAGTEYKVDGGGWTACDDTTLALSTFDWNGTEAVNVQFRTAAVAGKSFASDAKEVTIPVRQSAPNVAIDYGNETVNTTDKMEWSTDGKTWIDCSNDMTLAALGWKGEKITVQIRTKADGAIAASKAVEFTIPVRPSAPDSVVGSVNTLSGLTTDMEYSRDGKTWAAVKGTSMDLTAGDYYVRYKATSDKFASESVKVTVKPYSGKYSYETTVTQPEHGKISVDKYVTEGENVTITVTPDDGYAVDSVTVTAKNGKSVDVTKNSDGTYSFTMPKSNVTITATLVESDEPAPEPQPEPSALPFTDVSADAWYIDPVRFVYSEGLMTGTSATTFSPNLTTTRGMIVAILYRMEGEPDLSGENLGYPFADVDANAYYSDAVYWARLNGIVSGYSSDAFGPTDSITREQLAAILYNYAAYKGADTSARADLSAYSDSGSISGWATDAMQWTNAEGIVNGMSATELAPKGNATRAQVAAMLQRYITNVIG
ncbi:MAG: S-layer homology domain-containing protein, partial [Peptococcaceae bacterium]|nr:S-layer homology domain-containing protein [Peptococcaceae bacterium]